jgi:hypothetical protein
MKRGAKTKQRRWRGDDGPQAPDARPAPRQQKFERAGYDLTAATRFCDRCAMIFAEGYTWPGLGMPLVLCKDCTEDIEASVESYGEPPERSKARLMDRLRSIGA